MKLRVVGAVALLCLGVSPASAVTMEVTYTGTVTSGYDFAGLFGPSGRVLSGDSYAATFIFNPDIGRVQTSNSDYARGGAYMGTNSPMLESIVTINGNSQTIQGSYFSSIYAANFGFSETQQEVQDYSGGKFRSIDSTIYNFNGTFPSSLTAPFGPYTVGTSDTVHVTVNFDNLDAYGNSMGRDAYAVINVSTVTITAVPEPSTWAMMILGFAGLGFMMYRRKSKPASKLFGVAALLATVFAVSGDESRAGTIGPGDLGPNAV